jgi:hypothetical protein
MEQKEGRRNTVLGQIVQAKVQHSTTSTAIVQPAQQLLLTSTVSAPMAGFLY